ncbi:hypothetical protein IKT18_03685 [Candidatus Saccharibacteria bacterium]|nr:hypothetical protein [Candidatus Saccharibacteria bacterium]
MYVIGPEPNEAPSEMPPDGMPPDGEPGGAPGGQDGSSISYNGAIELTEDTSLSDQSYSSTSTAQNTLLVSEATVNLNNSTINKTGDASGDSADFYGTNAAILAYNNATLNITGGEITTDGAHANAVFAYGSGTVNLTDTKITTNSNNSGGIMVAGGGTLTATNLTVETFGNSSAPIRSDRGGGTMTIEGGNYTSRGVGSPAIYSTAKITVDNATLISTASEGIVIEGSNSVTIRSSTITDTNNQLNGNSETYKNIFIYQSMSGDAETGTGTFTAKNSAFVTIQGDHFFITNTTAVISLTSNKFINNDSTGVFLRAASGKWGTAGSNGGKVTLNAVTQEIIGDLVIDESSSLNLKLVESYFKGTVKNSGTTNLTLDANSIIVLTGDSYLSSLTNAATDNFNIYANGHKLYVAGNEVSINQDTAPESFLKDALDAIIGNIQDVSNTEPTPDINIPVLASCIIGGLLVLVAITTLIIKRKRRRERTPQPTIIIDTDQSNARGSASKNNHNPYQTGV